MKKTYALIAVLALAVGGYLYLPSASDSLGGGIYQAPIVKKASSTTFTLTTTSQRLLASTTSHTVPSKRISATIQPVNCTKGAGHAIFLNMNEDVVATQGNGTAVFASTTLILEDAPGLPTVQGSVTGITAEGTCTVLVTEYKAVNQ